jgi:site-specific DNA-methyltransferase (adenine-specific)
MESRAENSIHAIVTDPPFGLIEYTGKHLEKMRVGRGGVWRLPPVLDGCERKPLPRFTVLSEAELTNIRDFFEVWGKLALRILVPGAHLFIASNPPLTPFLSIGLISAGFERRGEIIRLIRTLRGGDRPKLAEHEYQDISVIPRSCYEPWGLFRKPISEKRVSQNLKRWKTGGLRRTPDSKPFPDVLKSEFPLKEEVNIAPHPSLKPQRFLRQIVWTSLPLSEGIVLDPFMGSGSTIAAAEALGYKSIGIEIDNEFYKMAKTAVPRLMKIRAEWESFETANNKHKLPSLHQATNLIPKKTRKNRKKGRNSSS